MGKKQLKAEIRDLRSDNIYLRGEVAKWCEMHMDTLRTTICVQTHQEQVHEKLRQAIHDAYLDAEDSPFTRGYNEAIKHVEALVEDLIGGDEKKVHAEESDI